jgi:glutamate carboxypeptidase
MADTPAKVGKVVVARFQGKGKKRILLLAHMDTVYLRGMLAKQPFRIQSGRAYGLGIVDDKQGIALVLHALAILKEMDFRDYGLVTVLINADEEMSSPGSRKLITREGERHDVVFSFEPTRADDDKLALATAGLASVVLKVKGKAAHASSGPGMGRNALYELAHQIMQTRDLSDPSTGLKMNWTIASAGTNRNVIPADATATADVRVLRVADFDRIEREVRERMKNKLIPDTRVEMTFERRRPPLEANPAARALGVHAQKVYAEIGKKLSVDAVAEGGASDAAFATLESKAATLERFGLQGVGAHSNDAEFILLDSIEPRLYLLTRMIMDVSQGRDR